MARDVLIIAEHFEGQVAPSTLELIAAGRTLAEGLGGQARVLVLGQGVDPLARRLAAYSIEVLVVDHPSLAAYTGDAYAQGVRSAINSTAPRVVLIGHTAEGYDLAPALAGSMDLPLVTNCLAVRWDGDRLRASRRILNEKVQQEVEIRAERPIVVTMRPGSVAPQGPSGGPARVVSVPPNLDPAALRDRFVRLERPEVEDIDLSGADIIVSAGRGIQKKENLALIEEFAKALGGVVGASRPLTDMDWLPKTRQVGQSGKTVRPKLYVACGISGAMQHVAGMKDASLIIAINTDPTAPIFEFAHLGFVGDVLKLLPATLKELKS